MMMERVTDRTAIFPTAVVDVVGRSKTPKAAILIFDQLHPLLAIGQDAVLAAETPFLSGAHWHRYNL